MKQRNLTFISGLYYYRRNGKSIYPEKIILEIEKSLKLNPWYKDKLVCYADTEEMSDVLLNHDYMFTKY